MTNREINDRLAALVGAAVEYEGDGNTRDAVYWEQDGEIVETGLFTVDLQASAELEHWYFSQPAADESVWRRWLHLLAGEAGETMPERASPRVRAVAVLRSVEELSGDSPGSPVTIVANQRTFQHRFAYVSMREIVDGGRNAACVMFSLRCYSSVGDTALQALKDGFGDWARSTDAGRVVGVAAGGFPRMRDIHPAYDVNDPACVAIMKKYGVFDLSVVVADRLSDYDRTMVDLHS